MRALSERLALLHEGMADAVGLAAELDEPPVVDDAVDHGGGHLVVTGHRHPPEGHQIRRAHPRQPHEPDPAVQEAKPPQPTV